MKTFRLVLALILVGGVALATGPNPAVQAQGQTIKIGILYDHSGPFSAAGSLNNWRGAKMISEYVNERGGVMGKYKVVQVDGDAQSKAEVAINEAERLLNAEKVDILAGIYSSAHAVPVAEKVDKQKRFLWITTAISSKVFDGRNLQYTFRAQPMGTQFGELSIQYVNDYARERLKKAPKDLRLAVIYEDGAYGTDVALGNELKAKELGLNIVLKEGYSVNAPDLSALLTKLPPPLPALPPGGEGAGAPRQAPHRPRRRPQPARQAEGRVRQGRRVVPPARPDRLPADRPEEAQARPRRPDSRDGEALQGALRPQGADRRHRPARLHGLQQHVGPPERRAPARHPEARRVVARRARQGRARDRHPRGRHDAGLRR